MTNSGRCQAAGLSQRVLATRIGYSRQYVSMTVWHDANLPSHELITAIDTELHAGGALIAIHAKAKQDSKVVHKQAGYGVTPDGSHEKQPIDSNFEAIDLEAAFDIWSDEGTFIAHELIGRDILTVDRRQAGALVGLSVGAKLLEPMERWLLHPQSVAAPVVAAGTPELDHLENAARVFREWDDTFGGGLRRKAVIGQLSEVNDLLRQTHPAAIKCRLQRILALLAETAATMSWDSGYQRAAQQYYMLAARNAKEAGDPALCANALAGMARQLLTIDVYGTVTYQINSTYSCACDAVELIRMVRGQFGGELSPTIRAMLHMREAWGYSKLGRLTAFRRACDKAYRAFADSDPTTEPYWTSYFDSAELAGTIGGRLLDFSRQDSALAGEAAETIEKAIVLRAPNRLRSSALDQLGIAEARMIQGELDEACRLAHTALDTVAKTGSDRVRKKLVRLYQHTQNRVDVSSMAQLQRRISPIVSATIQKDENACV